MKVQQWFKDGALMVLLSMAVSYIITLLFLSILSLCLLHTDMNGSLANVFLILTAVLSCLVGGWIAGKKMKTRRFLWGILAGIIYFVILCLIKTILGEAPVLNSPHALTSMFCCIGSGMLGGMFS